MKYFIREDEYGDETHWEVDDEPYCEHCGDLDSYDVVFFDGNTHWCISCANANGELKSLAKEELRELLTLRTSKQIEYYELAIKKLNNKDIDKEVEFWTR